MDSVSENAREHIQKGNLYAVGAAVLFGASPPFSKLLLAQVSPLMLAALLYLGAAGFLTIVREFSFIRRRQSSEARDTGFVMHPRCVQGVAFGSAQLPRSLAAPCPH